MIVWLASYPRSGNTLFRLVLHHAFGLKTYTRHAPGPWDPVVTEPGFAEIIGHRKLAVPLERAGEDDELYAINMHDLSAHGDRHPTVLLVRDGRDALVSFAVYHSKYAREPVGERIKRTLRRQSRWTRNLDRLIDRPIGQDNWAFWISAYLLRARLAPTAIVRFEDMVVEPIGQARKAMSALDLSTSMTGKGKGALPSFRELQSLYPNFFRSGRIGAWAEVMTEAQHLQFWQKHGFAMELAGYTKQGLAGIPGNGASVREPPTP